ncbi:Hypothetical predicted protein, partial [Marmota monax]
MPVACYGTLPCAAFPWSLRKHFEGTPRPASRCVKLQNCRMLSTNLSPNDVRIRSHTYFSLKHPEALIKTNVKKNATYNRHRLAQGYVSNSAKLLSPCAH